MSSWYGAGYESVISGDISITGNMNIKGTCDDNNTITYPEPPCKLGTERMYKENKAELKLLKEEIVLLKENNCKLNELIETLWYNPGPGGPGINIYLCIHEKLLT